MTDYFQCKSLRKWDSLSHWTVLSRFSFPFFSYCMEYFPSRLFLGCLSHHSGLSSKAGSSERPLLTTSPSWNTVPCPPNLPPHTYTLFFILLLGFVVFVVLFVSVQCPFLLEYKLHEGRDFRVIFYG